MNNLHLQLQHQSKKKLSFFEFWPSWLFYFPIKTYAALLMLRYRSFLLPTVANPYLAGGAFCGDAKSQILESIQNLLPEYSVPYILFDRQHSVGLDIDSEINQIIEQCQQHTIEFPFVVKPEFGCRGAGVGLMKSHQDLQEYLLQYPKNEKLIIQALIQYEHEAGVFYCRMPGQAQGKIISLTFKYFPKIIGDGQRTVQELIETDPRASHISQIYLTRYQKQLDQVLKSGQVFPLVFAGNHSKGAIFKNGEQFITKQLEDTFDEISKRLPEFYFGRFDIRFLDFSSLEVGKYMKVVEINGASAESTHIWDSDYSLWKAYRDIFKQFNQLFAISANNQKRGFKKQSWKTFYAAYQRDKKLTDEYPGTH